jgi:serine/threonine protein kinase
MQADIWSVGVIFFQMVFGKFPYTSTNATLMYHEIQTKKILNTECFEYNGYKASKQVTDFLRALLTVDKRKRLGWKELVKHPIFEDEKEKKEMKRLSDHFRINCSIEPPKINLNDEVENNHVKN